MPDSTHPASAADLGRPIPELSDSGLLWLINRVVFHPRGLALAFHKDSTGQTTGWSLLGDGSEAWSFPDDVDQRHFRQAEATLRATHKPAAADRRPEARRLTEDERLNLVDRLPADMNIWADDDELDAFTGRDRAWWAEHLGHPAAHRGCCRTCGCATTCLHDAYHEALVATVIRELNKLGALRLPEEIDHA